MNKQYICQMVKRWILLCVMVFAVSVTLISCKQIVWAETDNLIIVNHGLYEDGKDTCLVEGTDCEEKVPWINGENGKLIWKVSTDNFQEPIKAEVFKGEQITPIKVYETIGEYEIEILDVEYFGIYRLLVTDAAGNQKECRQYVKVDRQDPTPDEILISFQASELDCKSISYEDIKKNPIKKLQNFINHLFAKKTLTVTFYAPDATKLNFSYQNEEEYVLNSQDGYFRVELPVENGSSTNEIAGRIVITEVQDAAGNVCRLEVGKEIQTQGMIILDDVAPVLSKVSYTPQVNSQKIELLNYYFYQSSAKASFEILETNFEGVLNENTEKRLPIYSGGINGEWSYDVQRKTASSIAKFSGKNGVEQEYHYSLFYMDPSGNYMEGKDKYVCAEGCYQSDVIVIDQRPPVLKSFLIESNSKREFIEDNNLLYAANVIGDDVKITVVIDDHEKYFDKEKVLLEYSDDGVHWFPLKREAMCTVENRNHRLVYTFDGKQNSESIYRFRVSYEDRAGNHMILSENHNISVEEHEGGTYTSCEKVVIDQVNPQLNAIKFSKPVQMFQEEHNDSKDEEISMIKDRNTKLYYKENTEVTFHLEDTFLKSENIRIKVYYRENKGKEWKVWDNVLNMKKDLKDKSIKVDFTLPDMDAEYYFTIFYTDNAGNPMVYGELMDHTNLEEAYPNGILQNTNCYISPIFVKDTKEPVYEIAYNQLPEKYNSVDCVEMVLSLREMNLDKDCTIIKISAQDINGIPIVVDELKDFTYYSDSKNYVAAWEQLLETKTTTPVYPDMAEMQTLKLNLSTEANYRIFVEMVDKVGKKTIYEKEFCIDRTPPTITVVTKDGRYFTSEVKVQCGLLDFSESDITYEMSDGGVIDRIIDKLTFGYFTKSKLIVHVKVHDQVSGVEHLMPTCINEGNKKTSYKLSEKTSVVKDDKSIVGYEIELPSDFKGTVQMHGIDYAKNEAKDTGAIGMIVETEKQHKKYAKSSIEVVTPYSKTPNYYSGNIDIKYYVEDLYSGLGMVNYQAGVHKETIIYPAGEEICTENLKEHRILAKNNNTNYVKLALEFFDNAGHEEKLAKENIPTVHIDQTSPKIRVVYDNMQVENEKYYKADRIATITIIERNFDPEDTNLQITGPATEITEWKHVGGSECKGDSNPSNTNHNDDCKWITSILFSKDGEYTFTCDTTDLAGNKSVYGQVDAFVIDKTYPEMMVNYDNHDVKNEYYYKAPRTATIEIKEHNFNEADVSILMTAINDQKNLSVPAIDSWKSEGDIHRTTIVYDYDAQFEFEISYIDLAGNEAEEYKKDTFVVDLTIPEVEFFDILDCSANNGIVAPGVRYLDINYDTEGIVLEITGYKNGSVKMQSSKTEIPHGMELKVKDFEYMQEVDDLYTLHTRVYDLAGNYSEKTIKFSVNRFGSVYSFDDKTEKLVGKKGTYYTKAEPKIVVYETNVDTLEFREITLNFNGKLKTLVENMDFKIYENGNDESWKRYVYEIGKENFLEEGIYILTIYSEDRAKNFSDNNTKGKKIEFVVDKTAPSILITGIENGKQYREASKEITIDGEDNVCLGTMEVIVNGETRLYTPIEIAEMNGRMKYLLKSDNDWQNIQVISRDAAGNVARTERFKVLITPNVFVQMYRNTFVFYTMVGMMLIFSVGIAFFTVKKKKKLQDSPS